MANLQVWKEKLSQRPATDLGDSAASLLEQEKQQRERDLGLLLTADGPLSRAPGLGIVQNIRLG